MLFPDPLQLRSSEQTPAVVKADPVRGAPYKPAPGGRGGGERGARGSMGRTNLNETKREVSFFPASADASAASATFDNNNNNDNNGHVCRRHTDNDP